jgi:hypothetical protein
MNAIKICVVAGASLCLTACASAYRALEDKYLYGNVTQPRGVIDLGEHYSFRFVDKYRISHRWLRPTLFGCQYGKMPFVERDGILYRVSAGSEIRFIALNPTVYGTTEEGEFKGYTPFCGQFFLSSRNGVSVLIVKPDPAKGTDEWVEGARAVNINGLNWLFKEIAPRDMTGSTRGLAAVIEIWTLKIPDTAYWLVLKFSADLKYSIQEHFDQHTRMLDLFRQLVASVRLEPLQPAAQASSPTDQ